MRRRKKLDREQSVGGEQELGFSPVKFERDIHVQIETARGTCPHDSGTKGRGQIYVFGSHQK